MFCGAQPTVLNASDTPAPSAPVSVRLLFLAAKVEALSACTTTPPVSVITVLRSRSAAAPPSNRFVAIAALRAILLPVPNALPPELLA